MSKKNRREQQHLRQQPTRRKSYTLGSTAPNEIYKPGFPMNLFGNVKAFSIVGVGVAVIMVVTAVWTTQGRNTGGTVTETPTVTAQASASASATADPNVTPTPAPKTYQKAEQVIDAAKNNYTATVKTSKGNFEINLFADVAPNTVNSFVFLAKSGYFDGITFHRVVQNFVIQAGDPTGKGTGGPGYSTAEEPNDLLNKRGVIAMAKAGNAKEFGSQFFINLKDNPSLDSGNRFYPFAEVTSGMDVVDAIASVKVDANSKPVEPVIINSITITEKAR